MASQGIDWTEARCTKLRRMWKSGSSVYLIAQQIGVSRNAIIGKADRIGLPRRMSPIKGHKIKPKVPKNLRPLEQLGHKDCRYPFGNPKDKDFGFCGQPVKTGSSYCPKHYKLCRV